MTELNKAIESNRPIPTCIGCVWYADSICHVEPSGGVKAINHWCRAWTDINNPMGSASILSVRAQLARELAEQALQPQTTIYDLAKQAAARGLKVDIEIVPKVARKVPRKGRLQVSRRRVRR